jgi:hypothetical protein
MPTGVLMFFAFHLLVAIRAIGLLLEPNVSPDFCQRNPGAGVGFA